MRKEQDYLTSLIIEKESAIQDYDKMIIESENTLSKLVDNSVKLLSTLEGEITKLRI